MARVHVSDEVWADFRAAAGGKPLNLVLGKLVQSAVDRHRSKRLRDGSLDDAELLDALGRARELREDLEATVERIEWRLDRFSPSPPRHE